VHYSVDTFRHEKTIEILMATLCSVSVLISALKAYSWGRRSGKVVVDAETMFKFVLFTCESLSNVFLAIECGTALWLTFAYKLQKHLVYVLLSSEQEWSFVMYVTAAVGLKGVVLVHHYVQLATVETFFIDWERPRLGAAG